MKAKARGAKNPAGTVSSFANKLMKGIDRIGRKPNPMKKANIVRKQRVLPTVMRKPSKPVKRRRI